MGRMETNFLNTWVNAPLVWSDYIDYVFFIWRDIEEKLKFYLEDLNKYHPNINSLLSQIKNQSIF